MTVKAAIEAVREFLRLPQVRECLTPDGRMERWRREAEEAAGTFTPGPPGEILPLLSQPTPGLIAIDEASKGDYVADEALRRRFEEIWSMGGTIPPSLFDYCKRPASLDKRHSPKLRLRNYALLDAMDKAIDHGFNPTRNEARKRAYAGSIVAKALRLGLTPKPTPRALEAEARNCRLHQYSR